MSTLADNLVSSSSRILRLRARADLTAKKQVYQGKTYWVVKDPVALTYFRFQEEEYAILNMLDGTSSLDQIKRRFEREFPPQKSTVEELDRLIGMLHKSSLVVSDARGQGAALKTRGTERRRQEMLASMSNVLAIRFKGFDPDRFLNWTYPYVRWCFSRVTLAMCVILLAVAAILISVQWDVFCAKLPTFQEFFSVKNWLWLALTLSVTKVLHEFGHAFSCKHFGGECHEMGVMILVLTPCLYCNVSDSWMLPNKWHRVSIGAAGMYVELVIASICTFIWWFSQPGMLHYTALNIMFICSVSTLLVNANPLLRYDGYYILSDVVEIPNLRQKSSAVLNRTMGWWMLGIEPPEDPFLPERNHAFFALYSISAFFYRWVVVLSILWFLNRVFKPYGLELIGQLIAMGALYGLVVMPLWKLYKFFLVPGRIEKVKYHRLVASLVVFTVLLLCFVLVPLPFHVTGTLRLQPRDAQSVYVEIPGWLKEIHNVRHGELVTQDTPLVTIENIELELAIARLEGDRQGKIARLDSIRHRAIDDDMAALELEEVEKALQAVEAQLESRIRDRERLIIRAPASGTLLPPPAVRRQRDPSGRLPSWDGTPLEPRNLRAYLVQGALLCRIGDPQQLEAVIDIDQSDIDFVRKGQNVELHLNNLPGSVFNSTIEQISKQDLQMTPRSMSGKAGGNQATGINSNGDEQFLNTTYQASAQLVDDEGILLAGIHGNAKIDAGYSTLGSRLWRYVSRTFQFEF